MMATSNVSKRDICQNIEFKMGELNVFLTLLSVYKTNQFERQCQEDKQKTEKWKTKRNPKDCRRFYILMLLYVLKVAAANKFDLLRQRFIVSRAHKHANSFALTLINCQ